MSRRGSRKGGPSLSYRTCRHCGFRGTRGVTAEGFAMVDGKYVMAGRCRSFSACARRNPDSDRVRLHELADDRGRIDPSAIDR